MSASVKTPECLPTSSCVTQVFAHASLFAVQYTNAELLPQSFGHFKKFVSSEENFAVRV